MRSSTDLHSLRVLACGIAVAIGLSGCSRTKYRVQADREAYDAIAERNADPRWAASNVNIDLDPRSRYYDPFDPDRPPMPPDDPSSNRYMHYVDGKKGWKYWYLNGQRKGLENPEWRKDLGTYVEMSEEGAVQLDLSTAMRLAYVHSPFHQRQLETLYLSALDVAAERFFLDTQFFGGYDTRFAHNGSLIPKQIGFSPLLKRFVLTPTIDGDGVENNRLTTGRPFATDPALLMTRRFATAGELLIGFANSFVFEFTGSNVNLASSLANFSVIQPLLRGAGKDVALERLTFEERKLLANLRSYSQFRQGFYTQIAIGELGVTGPRRLGSTTTLQSFSGQGGVGGYLGLLQQRQQIRNGEDNLSLQLRTLSRLEALLASELIDLVQVDQFRQNVESQRADLLSRRNSLALSLDQYKTSQLGLPPDLSIELDESLTSQFQLFSRETIQAQEAIVALQRRVSRLPKIPEVAVLAQALEDSFELIEPVQKLFREARKDLDGMNEIVPQREKLLSEDEKEIFQKERERLNNLFLDLSLELKSLQTDLNLLREELSEPSRKRALLALSIGQAVGEQALAPPPFPMARITEQLLPDIKEVRRLALRQSIARGLISWLREFLELAESFALVPAQARLESITVDAIDLKAEEAFRIALANRLDFMNGRAALVDQWRLIQVAADALQSVLNITASGDIRTARNNPVSFRAPTGSLRVGLEFDAPFTRLLERNSYREAQIEYQRSRRDFIQSQDSLNLGVRALIRNLEQLRQNLEIQRGAVRIALRRVDQTQLLLNPARELVEPGKRLPINPTTAINLLGAQSSLRDTQNAFLSAWLSYYATRIRLYRELGVMVLDSNGQWVEQPLHSSEPVTPADQEESGSEGPYRLPRTEPVKPPRLKPINAPPRGREKGQTARKPRSQARAPHRGRADALP